MSTAPQEIEAVLRAVESAIAAGASAREIAALMYHESAIVVAEGTGSAARGLEELLPRMTEFMREWGSRPRMVLKVCAPVLAAESVAMTMVNVDVHPDKPDSPVLRNCALMGWKRDSRGWRVALEAVLSGVA
jgi:hypothetical protein